MARLLDIPLIQLPIKGPQWYSQSHSILHRKGHMKQAGFKGNKRNEFWESIDLVSADKEIGNEDNTVYVKVVKNSSANVWKKSIQTH